MATATDTKVPIQFKNAAKHVREMIEELLDPFEGKKLEAAQAAVAHVHRTAKPGTSDDWRKRYEGAIAKATAKSD